VPVARSTDATGNGAVATGGSVDGSVGWIVAVDATTGALMATEPDAEQPQAAASLNLLLPRYVPGSAYMLIAEDVYLNEAGELWQQRTWFNPDDASSWDSVEDLGAATNLVREVLLVDESGLLWRMRLWSDPANGGSWVTQESLGAFSQDAAAL